MSTVPPPQRPVSNARDPGMATMVAILVGSLGCIGLARGIVVPGTFPDWVPPNPVGGLLGASMLLAGPVAAGAWLGRGHSRRAAMVGLACVGVTWLFAGPLLWVPAAVKSATRSAPPLAGTLVAAPTIPSLLEPLALGLPFAVVVGMGLGWCGAEFSPIRRRATAVPDPRAVRTAGLAGLGAGGLLLLFILAGAPGLDAALVWGGSQTAAARSAGSPLHGGLLLLGPMATLGMVVHQTRVLRQLPSAPAPSAVAMGAWSFVFMLAVVGLPVSLSTTVAAALHPVPGDDAVLDAHRRLAQWDTMYDSTLVGLVGILLAALMITVATGLPATSPEPEADRLDIFR